MFMRRTLCVAWALLLAGAGCSEGPDLAQVSGMITLDGKPLPQVLVIFQPANARASIAETDREGRFTLGYTQSRTGAMIGSMEVCLQPVQDETGRATRFPPKFRQVFETVEVVAGKNEFIFDLMSDGTSSRVQTPAASK